MRKDDIKSVHIVKRHVIIDDIMFVRNLSMKVGFNELSFDGFILGWIHEIFTRKVSEVSALQNGGIRHLEHNRTE